MFRLRLVLVYAGSIALFLFLIPGATILAGRSLDRLLHWPSLPGRALSWTLGAILILAGLSLVKAAWQSLWRLGHGHPQEAFGHRLLPATQKVVIEGPYAYTRNPMVFGFLMNLLGIFLLFHSLSALILLYPFICAGAVLYLKKVEEPRLIRRFGQDYLDYQKRVSFLIPRVPD